MRLILTIAIVLGWVYAAFSQTAADQPEQFQYQIEGTVFDEQARAMPKIFVCFVPAERPLSGRLPCAETDGDGKFSLTVRATSDQYLITASTSRNGFLVKTDENENSRSKNSGLLFFGPADEKRELVIQFDAPPADPPTV